jgi:enoyl-CoA hydratase
MAYENIDVTRDGGVATIQLDRPKSLNALNNAMMGEVAQALTKLEQDDAIGCVIITGSEKAFAAGADIKEMVDSTYLERWLCAGRGLRNCDDVRFYHRGG